MPPVRYTVISKLSTSSSEFLPSYAALGNKVCQQVVDQKQLDEQKKKYARLNVEYHPSLVRLIETTSDHKKSTLVLEDFDQDLVGYLKNRNGIPLTNYEFLVFFRQVAAGLAALEYADTRKDEENRITITDEHAHGDVCLRNILVSTNSQKQKVFKFGYLNPKKPIPADATHQKDKFNLALLAWQVRVGDTRDISEISDQEIGIIRSKLEKDKPTRSLFTETLADLLFTMLDPEPKNRPIIKNVQITLAALNLLQYSSFDDSIRPSIEGQEIIPAGYGDAITKNAQQGNTEAQYRLALLLDERGLYLQAFVWFQKAAEKNHALAHFRLGLACIANQGCILTKDEEKKGETLQSKAEFHLSKGIEIRKKENKNIPSEIQIALANLILSRGARNQEENDKAAELYCRGAENKDYTVNPLDLKYLLTLKLSAPVKEAINKLINDKTLNRTDIHMARGDGRHVLAVADACLEVKSNHPHPFDKVPSVRVESLYGCIADQLQKYLLLHRLPKHPHLAYAIGYRGYFKSSDLSQPNDIAALIPSMPTDVSLADFIAKKENADKSEKLTLTFAQQLAEGLAAMHENHILHSDLSLSRIVVTHVNDDVPQLKLAGMQQLRHLRRNTKETKKESADDKNEIFAFGMTLLDMVVKIYKINKIDNLSININYDKTLVHKSIEQLTKIAEEYARKIDKFPASVPKEIRELIKKCLAAEESERPTARQIVESLATLTQTKPKAVIESGPIDTDVEYKNAMQKLATDPEFAAVLLRDAADAGHTEAQKQLAELLWNGELISENKEEAIYYYTLAAEGRAENQARLDQMRAEIEKHRQRETESAKAEAKQEQEQKAQATPKPTREQTAEYMLAAFCHFFGYDGVLHDYGMARDYLVKASEGKENDLNAQLARAILARSTNPLNETSPLRFFVPGNQFAPPFVELTPAAYRYESKNEKDEFEDSATQCTIAGKLGVLVAPKDYQDIDSMVDRLAIAQANVIGAIGITIGAANHPIALLYAPVQAGPVDRKAMMASGNPAMFSTLLALGVANGLLHLHSNKIIHGNVSLRMMSDGSLTSQDRSGLIATGPASSINPTAPESLIKNQLTFASDIFQFGESLAHMLIGDAWENCWYSEKNPQVRLAKLTSCAVINYKDLRDRMPPWVPQPLTDLMMRCLRLDSVRRPKSEDIANELQILQKQLASQAAATGVQPNQFWLHTAHICLYLTADETDLRYGGIHEIASGPRIRDRMQESHNPSTNHCYISQKALGVIRSEVLGTKAGQNSMLSDNERKKIEYMAQFYKLFSADIGTRHFKRHARGIKRLPDKNLNANIDRAVSNPSYYAFEEKECSGEADKCQCHRASQTVEPKIFTRVMPPDLMRHLSSFLGWRDYFAGLACVTKYANDICEGNTIYFHNINKIFGNIGGGAYFPIESSLSVSDVPAQQKKLNAAMTRLWAKVTAIQQTSLRAQATLNSEIADAELTPDATLDARKSLIDKANHKFNTKNCYYKICLEKFSYTVIFADKSMKKAGNLFMSEQFEKNPFWFFNQSKRFCTADLFEVRIKMSVEEKSKPFALFSPTDSSAGAFSDDLIVLKKLTFKRMPLSKPAEKPEAKLEQAYVRKLKLTRRGSF